MSKRKKIICTCLFAVAVLLLLKVGAEFVYIVENGSRFTDSFVSLDDYKKSNLRAFPEERACKYKIAVFGGSTSYSMGVSDDDSWPRLLEQKLIARNDRDYCVYNFGMLGGNLQEMLELLKYIPSQRLMREQFIFEDTTPIQLVRKPLIVPEEYDLVLLLPQINDLAPDYYYEIINRYAPSLFLARKIFTKIGGALGHYLNLCVSKRIEAFYQKRVISSTIVASLAPELERRYTARMQQFVQYLEGKTKIILLYLPPSFMIKNAIKEAKWFLEHFYYKNKDELLNQYLIMKNAIRGDLKVMRRIADEFDINFFVLSDIFMKEDIGSIYIDSIHFSERGNEIIAEYLLKRIEKLSIITERVD